MTLATFSLVLFLSIAYAFVGHKYLYDFCRIERIILLIISLNIAPYFFSNGALVKILSESDHAEVLATIAGLHWLGWVLAACFCTALLHGRNWFESGFLGASCAFAGVIIFLEIMAIRNNTYCCELKCNIIFFGDLLISCNIFPEILFPILPFFVTTLYGLIIVYILLRNYIADMVTFFASLLLIGAYMLS
jgi:hypothetical protein